LSCQDWRQCYHKYMPNNKAIIVDDEEDICVFMMDLFKRRGFVGFSAMDTAEALEIFKKERPHLCVLDVHMPFSPYNGLELLRRIKEVDKNAYCVMITRIEDNMAAAKAARYGAADYVIKPVELKKVDEVIALSKTREDGGV